MVPGESMDAGDKGTPKAMSVALRIALLQALCIPTDEPDPDTHSYERAAAPQPQTDWEWANNFEARVGAADSVPELRGLWEEMTVKHQRSQLTHADRSTFEQVLNLRRKELEDSPA